MTRIMTMTFLAAAVALAACQAPEGEDQVAETSLEVSSEAFGLQGGFPSGFDPCDLISAEEAAEAAGQAVGEAGSEISRWGIATCTFEPAEGLMPPVVLEVRPDEGAYETALEMASSPDPVDELDGVGDRAFYSTLAGHNIVLVASGRYANIIVRRDDDDDNRQRAIDLARRVADRLD